MDENYFSNRLICDFFLRKLGKSESKMDKSNLSNRLHLFFKVKWLRVKVKLTKAMLATDDLPLLSK